MDLSDREPLLLFLLPSFFWLPILILVLILIHMLILILVHIFILIRCPRFAAKWSFIVSTLRRENVVEDQINSKDKRGWTFLHEAANNRKKLQVGSFSFFSKALHSEIQTLPHAHCLLPSSASPS